MSEAVIRFENRYLFGLIKHERVDVVELISLGPVCLGRVGNQLGIWLEWSQADG